MLRRRLGWGGKTVQLSMEIFLRDAPERADCQGLDGQEQGGLVALSDTPGCTSILLAYLVADSVIKSK